MLFCDGCNIGVHQLCYGIASIPTGDWFCDSCAAGVTNTVACTLCPNRGGAFKRVTGSQKKEWVHVSCALWIPEARINGPDVSSVAIKGIPNARYNLSCCLCKEKRGACIQCNLQSCVTAFHVSCAVRHGLRMDLFIDEADMVHREAYCARHCSHTDSLAKVSGQSAVSTGAAVKDTQQHEREDEYLYINPNKEFCDFVSLEAAQSELTVLQPDHLRAIFAYWVLKRRAQHGRPLVSLTTAAERRKTRGGLRMLAAG